MKLLGDGKVCDILVYFERPEQLNDLKYTEFFNAYRHAYRKPARFQRLSLSNEAFTIDIPRITRPLYIFKRDEKVDSITRMEMVAYYSGEHWYLRLILKSFSCRSINELKSFDGHTYETIQESAVARGLVQDNKECLQVFRESIPFTTPRGLRSLFAVLTIQGFPTVCIFNNKEYLNSMLTDLIVDDNWQRAYNNMLIDLSKRLQDEGKTLSEYELPEPQDVDTELQREVMKYDPQQQLQLYAPREVFRPRSSCHILDDVY